MKKLMCFLCPPIACCMAGRVDQAVYMLIYAFFAAVTIGWLVFPIPIVAIIAIVHALKVCDAPERLSPYPSVPSQTIATTAPQRSLNYGWVAIIVACCAILGGVYISGLYVAARPHDTGNVAPNAAQLALVHDGTADFSRLDISQLDALADLDGAEYAKLHPGKDSYFNAGHAQAIQHHLSGGTVVAYASGFDIAARKSVPH